MVLQGSTVVGALRLMSSARGVSGNNGGLGVPGSVGAASC